jgi:hypothetical protein
MRYYEPIICNKKGERFQRSNFGANFLTYAPDNLIPASVVTPILEGDDPMEPISAIALTLALGAGAFAGKTVVSELVKDAYASLKDLVKSRYPKVSVEQLEGGPESEKRRAVIEEDLATSGAGQDTELAAAAHTLIKLIEQHAPAAAAAIGVDLKDVSAANLRLADIAAPGTGVKVEGGRFTGDIDIRGVRAGMSPGDAPERN